MVKRRKRILCMNGGKLLSLFNTEKRNIGNLTVLYIAGLSVLLSLKNIILYLKSKTKLSCKIPCIGYFTVIGTFKNPCTASQ